LRARTAAAPINSPASWFPPCVVTACRWLLEKAAGKNGSGRGAKPLASQKSLRPTHLLTHRRDAPHALTQSSPNPTSSQRCSCLAARIDGPNPVRGIAADACQTQLDRRQERSRVGGERGVEGQPERDASSGGSRRHAARRHVNCGENLQYGMYWWCIARAPVPPHPQHYFSATASNLLGGREKRRGGEEKGGARRGGEERGEMMSDMTCHMSNSECDKSTAQGWQAAQGWEGHCRVE